MSEKLGCLEWGWLGVFIAPTTKPTVGECCCRWAHRTVRCATGHWSVCQPRHPNVRVLTVFIVGALTSWGTGQSGAAPEKHCSLSGAPSGAVLTLRELSAYYSAFAGVRWSRPLRWSRCSAWCTGQSGGTPNSPVNYSGAALQKPEGEEFSLYGPWCTGHCPVRQTRVLFGFFCSFLLNPNLDLFIGLC
jgi:hypothetical protein